MKKTAIVTGYSSGIGKAISEILTQNSYEVLHLKSRLEDIKSLEIEIKTILKIKEINILVNCAGIGIFQPHEEISLAKIKEIIDINLTAPIILTNLLLRSLKKTKGNIINITSIEATKHSKFSALYTASYLYNYTDKFAVTVKGTYTQFVEGGWGNEIYIEVDEEDVDVCAKCCPVHC